MKKILVTGCTGYIGGTFCYEALKKGFKIIGIDNLSNSHQSIAETFKKKFTNNFHFIKKDILDDDAFVGISSADKIDAVIHFAALKSVSESELYPELYFRNNIEGTKKIIEILPKLSIKKLIFSSSASVYGNQKVQPVTEDMIVDPLSTYAKTKRICEKHIENTSKNKKLNAISLRYFNPLGAHADKVIKEKFIDGSGSIMSNIIRTSLGLNENLTIFGDDYDTKDGTGERDYIHILDIIDGHFKALDKLDHINGHEIINLGTGRAYSVFELINTFQRVNNVKIATTIVGKREGDLATSYANPDKAKRELNWYARYNLDEMCRDAWDSVKSEFK